MSLLLYVLGLLLVVAFLGKCTLSFSCLSSSILLRYLNDKNVLFNLESGYSLMVVNIFPSELNDELH